MRSTEERLAANAESARKSRKRKSAELSKLQQNFDQISEQLAQVESEKDALMRHAQKLQNQLDVIEGQNDTSKLTHKIASQTSQPGAVASSSMDLTAPKPVVEAAVDSPKAELNSGGVGAVGPDARALSGIRVPNWGVHLDAAGITKVVKDETATILAVLSCEQLGAAVAHAEALAAKFQLQGNEADARIVHRAISDGIAHMHKFRNLQAAAQVAAEEAQRREQAQRLSQCTEIEEPVCRHQAGSLLHNQNEAHQNDTRMLIKAHQNDVSEQQQITGCKDVAEHLVTLQQVKPLALD